MRRLSGYLLAGAMLMLPALNGDGAVYAQEKTLTFDGDTAILTVAIKPDKTADFEQIMKDVSAALMKSEKPERKQQAAGWKVVKSATPMKDGNVVYMHMINPVVKGADYTRETVVGADLVESWGGRIVLAHLAEGHSTTATIRRMSGG